MSNNALLDQIKLDPAAKEKLWRKDYFEEPVDIETFINDPRYLGKATNNGKRLYDVWHDTLKEAFSSDELTEIVLTGGAGIGKTSAAVIGLAYIMYRTLNMRDPHAYYDVLRGKPLTIVFFSMSMSLSDSVNFMAFQGLIKASPWFSERGVLRGRVKAVLHFDNIDYRLSSPRSSGYGTVSADVIGGVLDELNTPGESLTIRERTFRAYESAVRRLENRFMDKGYVPGLKLFLCASKDDELSFVDSHIEKRRNSLHMLVKDISIWEAKPHKYSGKMFPIAVGNAFLPSKVIEEEEVPKAIEDGYKIAYAPIEHYEAFVLNVVGALRDIAGVTVAGIRRYKLFPTEKYANDAMDSSKVDPVKRNIIYTDLNDQLPWIDYIDLDKISLSKDVPRCIHMDIGLAHDAMGIAMSGVHGWREVDVVDEAGLVTKDRVAVIETDLALRIKARDGANIPLHKMRRLFLDLRDRGFKIAKVTADLRLLSADTMQVLNHAGIKSEHFSVDRPTTPYLLFRDLVFERRWICHYHPWLAFEMRHIEYDQDNEKIDHPIHVKDTIILDGVQEVMVGEGTKDLMDAVVGSVYQALLLGKSPVDVKAHLKVLQALNPPKGVNEYWKTQPWFINDKSLKEVGQPVLVDSMDKMARYNKALTKLRFMKQSGVFRSSVK